MNYFLSLISFCFLLANCAETTDPPQKSSESIVPVIEKQEAPVTDNVSRSDKVVDQPTGKKVNPTMEDHQEKSIRPKSSRKPAIVFDSQKFNFGEIYHGDKVQHDFVFTNKGNRDLEIKNVWVSCGCTKPSYPFLAIAPGEQGTIGITYNSVGKQGYQRATVRVMTNDPDQSEVVLRINGRVLVKSLEELEKEKQAQKEVNVPE
ncbi:MAG: DUF1573 domain-containing protein [Saprospiraceae bacterium]|nr:DUF1573 domain-containing protein [Saprospiraceae bacterium]